MAQPDDRPAGTFAVDERPTAWPPVMQGRPAVCVAVVCLLYAAQGMPDGFVRIGLKTFLLDRGATVGQVGDLIALISWPWAVKWAWGPVIDRFRFSAMGRRRPWVLAAQGGMLAVLLGLLWAAPEVDGPGGLTALGAMVLAVNVFAAMQDVAVDALAIDRLPEEARGMANGLMQGSVFLGGLVGGRVLGGVLLADGLRAAVALEVLILAGVASVPLLVRERRGDRFLPGGPSRDTEEGGEKPSVAGLARQLGRAFTLPSAWAAVLLALLATVGHSAYGVLWPAHLRAEAGWTADRWLALEGGWGVGAGLAASLAGGALASAVSARKAAAAGTVGLTGVWLAHAWAGGRMVEGLFLAEVASYGVLNVALLAVFMGSVWRPVAATQFSAFMAASNLSYGLGAKLAAPLAAAGPRAAFLAMAGLQAATLLALWRVQPGEADRRLGA